MASHTTQRAIDDAIRTGKAVMKFIAPNDTSATHSHQCGFLLPKGAWSMYTPVAPVRGKNDESEVRVTWEDGRVTRSKIKWYGAHKNEYRLTTFGRDFPYRTPDFVGSLLVLVVESFEVFRAYILDSDEEIEDLQAALGVEIIGRWTSFDAESEPTLETEDECLDRIFRAFAGSLTEFPSTAAFSERTHTALLECARDLLARSSDDILRLLVDAEYELFRLVERRLCDSDIRRLFRDVDDFLRTASTIMNRRKSRAGRSLENHVAFLLRKAEVPFDSRCRRIPGEPDIMIPSENAYLDPNVPVERLCMVGVKTTCKDRWRQVLNEADRMQRRHILTMQPAISGSQLRAMALARVSLVVPKHLHRSGYPLASRNGVELLSVDEFVDYARGLVAK